MSRTFNIAGGAPEAHKFGPFNVLAIRQPFQRRSLQLFVGLVLFGVALSLAIEAGFGTNPWTVFHVGLGTKLGLTTGTMVILTGAALLLATIPLAEPVGLGTIANVIVIGPALDICDWLLPELTSLLPRLAAIAVAPILLGLASGLYIGAGLGPGPRDSIMTALERRGMAVWLARTSIEVTALTVGWVLGGPVGLGTLWMAGSVGWWVQVFLRRLRLDPVPLRSNIVSS